MVPSRQLARVLAEVETREAKIVLVGDAMQLQPIEAGAAFRAVTERVGYVELQGIRRQREAWMTMPHPNAIDDVDASALVIEAEMAIEIVNRARAIVQSASPS